MHMSDAPDFRAWAARVARQAGQERNAKEAQRLMVISQYWARLAEMDDRQRESANGETTH